MPRGFEAQEIHTPAGVVKVVPLQAFVEAIPRQVVDGSSQVRVPVPTRQSYAASFYGVSSLGGGPSYTEHTVDLRAGQTLQDALIARLTHFAVTNRPQGIGDTAAAAAEIARDVGDCRDLMRFELWPGRWFLASPSAFAWYHSTDGLHGGLICLRPELVRASYDDSAATPVTSAGMLSLLHELYDEHLVNFDTTFNPFLFRRGGRVGE